MSQENENLLQQAQLYASRYQLTLGQRLGFGTHGTVFCVEDKSDSEKSGRSAIKVHSDSQPYHRERTVYERLAEHEVTDVDGFKVPEMLRADDALLVIEMTVVTRPYLLDFAGAYLDHPPEFPEEVWADWLEKKQEEFGRRWAIVESVLATLKSYGVYLLDIHPRNITFFDPPG